VHNISKSASKGLFSDLEIMIDPQSSEKKINAAYVCLSSEGKLTVQGVNSKEPLENQER
jgi:hypothetical protein